MRQKEYLREFNRQHGYKCGNSICNETAHVVVVFTAVSFDKEYSEESRSYIMSSDNKAFLDGMGVSQWPWQCRMEVDF